MNLCMTKIRGARVQVRIYIDFRYAGVSRGLDKITCAQLLLMAATKKWVGQGHASQSCLVLNLLVFAFYKKQGL